MGDQLAKNAKQYAVGGITGVGRKLTYADKLRIKRNQKKSKKLQNG